MAMPRCFANTELAKIAAFMCTKIRPYKVLGVDEQKSSKQACGNWYMPMEHHSLCSSGYNNPLVQIWWDLAEVLGTCCQLLLFVFASPALTKKRSIGLEG